MIEVPVWEKSNLTLEEAAAYSGIGINKLRKLSDTETCPFVLWIGSKRLIKRRKLDVFSVRYSFSTNPILDNGVVLRYNNRGITLCCTHGKELYLWQQRVRKEKIKIESS